MMTFYVLAEDTGAVTGWGMCESSILRQQQEVVAPRQCVEVSEQDYLKVAAASADYRVQDGALIHHG